VASNAAYFRVDVTREIDLVEEIARLYGYGRIPVTLPKATGPLGTDAPAGSGCPHAVPAEGSGYSEVVTYSFVPSSFRLSWG
jgi:phenylalanyl-tRNA synthetase beta chain